MRKVITFIIAIVMLFSSFASADIEDLSEKEKQFLGSWVLNMKSKNTTFLYTITFFDDLNVFMKTLTFDGSTLTADNISTGQWCGFSDNVIVLTLSGKSCAGGIREDGMFMLMDYKTKEALGFFTRCPDLSDLMVESVK